METENCWTFEKDEMLIELVKQRPGLYSIQSSHYSDHAYKKKTWNEIEQVIQLPSPKNRWESLRGQYRKYLGKVKKSGQKGFKISKWRYLDQMQFINDHINVEIPQLPFTDEETSVENTWFGDRASLNFPTDNGIEDQVMPDANDSDLVNEQLSDPVQTSTKTPGTRKRKIGSASIKENTSSLMKYLLENQQQERLVHPLDHFFKLMAATVKNFSPTDQYVVKTTVFNLVSGLEEKYLTQSHLDGDNNSQDRDASVQQTSHTNSTIRNPSQTGTSAMSDKNVNPYPRSPVYKSSSPQYSSGPPSTYPPSPSYSPTSPLYSTVKVEYQSNDEL
ncbi:uncharacterized protein LOC123865162 isoform X2 [Maniola jurtina]|uniref:uncharacterized protein LOC123865162 isoform X2 n=1 Tax=Maniola jurtina TaxID=191418 RepID=UPI001E68EAF6|nr:uncharacterized protein LOC123865162 isoform X2 [Maniola jurtina]